MNSALIISILTGVASILSRTNLTSPAIQNAITMLTGIIPLLIKEYQDVLPSVKNIIEVLKGSSDITVDQLDALDAMSEKIDDEFSDAVDEYLKNHPEGN